jgi:hypothetical protein
LHLFTHRVCVLEGIVNRAAIERLGLGLPTLVCDCVADC